MQRENLILELLLLQLPYSRKELSENHQFQFQSSRSGCQAGIWRKNCPHWEQSQGLDIMCSLPFKMSEKSPSKNVFKSPKKLQKCQAWIWRKNCLHCQGPDIMCSPPLKMLQKSKKKNVQKTKHARLGSEEKTAHIGL